MNDNEKRVMLILNKIIEETGSIDILKNFNNSIMNYFFAEYFNEDYEMENLVQDICDIGNAFLENEKYAILHKVLNQEDLDIDVSIIVNEIENYIVGV